MSADPIQPSEEIESGSQVDATDNPRAFATATGFVLQIVGFVYVGIALLCWVASSNLQDETDVPVNSLVDYFDEANIVYTITTANILAGIVGGLAMLTFGIGLQGEQRRSGLGAMMTTGLLAAIALTSAVLYVVVGPTWLRAIVVTVVALINTALFLLAGHSAALLKQYPPPKDQNVVDDAWLEEYARNRKHL